MATSHHLSFENAMTLHVLRAQGLTYVELMRRFGNHSYEFTKILRGKVHQSSRYEAITRLSRGDYWHPEIVLLIEQFGSSQILTSLKPRPPTDLVEANTETNQPWWSTVAEFGVAGLGERVRRWRRRYAVSGRGYGKSGTWEGA